MPSATDKNRQLAICGRGEVALLAWKLDGSGTVVDDVVVGGSGKISGSSGVCRRLKGGRNSKYKASNSNQRMT